jgi:hypothetical protein
MTNSLVTCLASHLTTIAVEEYSAEKKSTTSTTEVKKTGSTATDVNAETKIVINMWSSWAIYALFIFVGVMLLGVLWARRRDMKDE